MRVPLSWLRDFAPFGGDAAAIAATLDDLGLVVEGIEQVGEGLADVVVARIEEVAAIEGADKIRRVVVTDGTGPVEVVCGARNFAVGDLVALAPVGAVLPGGFAIGRRKMKGMVSNGMLCSGRELRLSEDHEGILVMNDVERAAPGVMLTEALGIEPDVVFDVAVEANRPDAWCMAGVARDLAARLDLEFTVPTTADLVARVAGAAGAGSAPQAPTPSSGPPVESLADVRVDDLELCPRFTSRVLTGVVVDDSPPWMARRLTAAGMRPINNVVDASNYVMLELGQPTHPYDLDHLDGGGLLVRRAAAGETVTTLDGVVRTLGRPGPGLGDTGQDCLICDATGTPVGIGGIMGGASSEIGPETTRVLLEAAYFVPMAIARTSKRLTLRTEASARFERGCDPEGIDRAAERFCELLALTGGPDLTLAAGVIDVVGDVPAPLEVTVRPARINGLLGTDLTATAIAGLLAPLGMLALATGGDDDPVDVVVPTFRPDVRPLPMGEADLAEEVARTYGYSRLPRRKPAWPEPGRLTDYQRERRRIKDVLCGLGASEAWTAAFVSEADQLAAGFAPPYVEVTNPLVEAERFLRSSMAPGLLRAVLYNAERRQGDVRLFEVGSVFQRMEIPSGDGPPAESTERLCAVFADGGDDAWSAVAAWHTIADAVGLAEWEMEQGPHHSGVSRALHEYRSATLLCPGASAGSRRVVLGVVGELDPTTVETFGLVGADGRPRRVGWLDLDLGVLLDPAVAVRRPLRSTPISRFPSSDVDLAFVVPEAVPAGSVEATLVSAGGDLVESVQLFDVYRGESVGDGFRSLAYRLRFCALDRTLTDEEVGSLRAACIAAVEEAHRATLR
ncbi:MAG: phenylalanine--tRNA ligase subunit beta [Acidimicrobiales bacterium]